MKIQLKRSNVLEGGAAKEPTAGQMEYGELAVNYNGADPTFFIKDSNNQVIGLHINDIGKATSGPNPPINGNQVGDLFYDTTTNQLLYWNGTAWVTVATALNDLSDVTITNAQNGELLVWNGSAWVNSDPGYLTESEVNNILNGNLPDGTPDPGAPEYITADDLGDGTITILDADGGTVGSFTTNQAGDTDITLPEIPVPEDQIVIGDTEPGTPELGDLWVDTTECPPVLKIYSDCDGTEEWKPIGGEPPVIGEIAQPSILAPGEGAGIGGDVTYTPKTSAITAVASDDVTTQLTLTDGNTYNADTDEDMGQPITETFPVGGTANSSTITDVSGNQITVDGPNGGTLGLYFQGAQGASANLTQNYSTGTLSVLYASAFATDLRVLNVASNGYLRVRTDTTSNNLEARTFTGNQRFASDSTLTANKVWNHIVFQMENSTIRVFVNGAQKDADMTGINCAELMTASETIYFFNAPNANSKTAFAEGYFVPGQVLAPSTFVSSSAGASPVPKPSADVIATIGDFGADGFYMPFSSTTDPYQDASGAGNSLANVASTTIRNLPYDFIDPQGTYDLFKVGETVVGQEATKAAPGAADLEFVGSIPDGTNITTWGVATWEVTDVDNGGTMTDTKAIADASSTQVLAPSDRSNINLAGGTTYRAKLKYSSSNPAVESIYSDVVNFKTAGGGGNAALGGLTTLYPGNDGTQKITNGIDLANDGGLVWLKSRTVAQNHRLFDTVRGQQYSLVSDGNGGQTDHGASGFVSFDSDGFTLGNINNGSGALGGNYVAWTFAKAAGYFDVVKYEGAGGVQTVPHNLKAVPGMIIIKRLDNPGNWTVYHSSLGAGKQINLNFDSQKADATSFNATPTDTEFYLNNNVVNLAGEDFIAYLFADDTPGVIKCGSFDGGAAESINTITTDFKPQWLLIKNSTEVGSWEIYDSQRDLAANVAGSKALSPNTDAIEANMSRAAVSDTGFTYKPYRANSTFIYVAIADPGTTRFYDEANQTAIADYQIVSKYGVDPETADLSQLGIAELTQQPTYPVAGYVTDGDKYTPIEDQFPRITQLKTTIEDLESRLSALENPS